MVFTLATNKSIQEYFILAVNCYLYCFLILHVCIYFATCERVCNTRGKTNIILKKFAAGNPNKEV